MTAKKPSRSDPSKPKGEGYAYKKEFYRSHTVAEDYDQHRFSTPERRRRNVRKWRTILAALQLTDGVRSILDIPCGTGRFTGSLAQHGYLVFGSDISHEMMRSAAEKLGPHEALAGYLQADAEALPLAEAAVDCVMSIRFMFHVDSRTRVRILREMGRVSRRWLIVDYRHRYTLRYAKRRLQRAVGFGGKPLERVSSTQLRQEFGDAGLSIRRVLSVTRGFSDKWIVLAEKARS